MLKRRLRISQVLEIEGIGKSVFYERLSRGEYDSVGEGKGRRITEESIERRRAAVEKRQSDREETAAA
jgi:hypothetical protein